MAIVAKKPSINQASVLFRQLHDLFNLEPSDDRVNELASDLSAHIAAFRHPICLGIFEKEKLRRIYGLTFLLSGYGVTLRSKRRPDEMVFIYGEIELPVEVQFAQSYVRTAGYGVAAA